MSAALLEARLAALLSTPQLAVGTGAAAVGGAATAAAVAVAGVTPRPALASRLPGQLLPRRPQRVSSVTVRAVLSVGPGPGAAGRAEALEAATLLWWRCEDDPVATGSGFPADDLTQGYRVLEVLPVAWTAPGAGDTDAAAAEPRHLIELDVVALFWPRSAAPQEGDLIGPVVVRLGAEPSAARLRLRVGERATIGLEIDLRSVVLNPHAPGDPAPAPRRLDVTVVPTGDAAAGSVPDGTVELDQERATVEYVAGPAPGRDEVRFTLVPEGVPPFTVEPAPLGVVHVEVHA